MYFSDAPLARHIISHLDPCSCLQVGWSLARRTTTWSIYIYDWSCVNARLMPNKEALNKYTFCTLVFWPIGPTEQRVLLYAHVSEKKHSHTVKGSGVQGRQSFNQVIFYGNKRTSMAFPHSGTMKLLRQYLFSGLSEHTNTFMLFWHFSLEYNWTSRSLWAVGKVEQTSH